MKTSFTSKVLVQVTMIDVEAEPLLSPKSGEFTLTFKEHDNLDSPTSSSPSMLLSSYDALLLTGTILNARSCFQMG